MSRVINMDWGRLRALVGMLASPVANIGSHFALFSNDHTPTDEDAAANYTYANGNWSYNSTIIGPQAGTGPVDVGLAWEPGTSGPRYYSLVLPTITVQISRVALPDLIVYGWVIRRALGATTQPMYGRRLPAPLVYPAGLVTSHTYDVAIEITSRYQS